MSTRWPAAVPPASPSTPTTTTKSPADSSNAARAINDRILPGEEGPPSSYRSQSSNTIDHWRIKNIDSSSNRFRAGTYLKLFLITAWPLIIIKQLAQIEFIQFALKYFAFAKKFVSVCLFSAFISLVIIYIERIQRNVYVYNPKYVMI